VYLIPISAVQEQPAQHPPAPPAPPPPPLGLLPQRPRCSDAGPSRPGCQPVSAIRWPGCKGIIRSYGGVTKACVPPPVVLHIVAKAGSAARPSDAGAGSGQCAAYGAHTPYPLLAPQSRASCFRARASRPHSTSHSGGNQHQCVQSAPRPSLVSASPEPMCASHLLEKGLEIGTK